MTAKLSLQHARAVASTALLSRLIDAPDLVARVRGLAPASFASLVRRIGVEDAGEVVALATTEQLVAAFDEELFTNDRPGERERFDVERFVTWLEVLLEAGDEVAAARFAELSEDFVIQALSSVILVLDDDALRARLDEGDSDARLADKALESALTEEIDGYLLVARRALGWDAALALVVALDLDHRPLLARLLDRCAALASGYVEDLESLTELLSAEDSLAEDVEGEREERRSRAGFVEPRAARSFLALARSPVLGDPARAERDPITRAYFRELEPRAASKDRAPRERDDVLALQGESAPALARRPSGAAGAPLLDAMRALHELDPVAFAERIEELAYLANVLVAGSPSADGGRLAASEAASRVLDAVGRGAAYAAKPRRPLVETLRACHADVLFRLAESAPAPSPAKRRPVLIGKGRRQSP